jgi:hypothetical protein
VLRNRRPTGGRPLRSPLSRRPLRSPPTTRSAWQLVMVELPGSSVILSEAKPSEESHGIPAPVPAKPSEESRPNRHHLPPARHRGRCGLREILRPLRGLRMTGSRVILSEAKPSEESRPNRHSLPPARHRGRCGLREILSFASLRTGSWPRWHGRRGLGEILRPLRGLRMTGSRVILSEAKPSEESHGIPAPVPAKPSEESHGIPAPVPAKPSEESPGTPAPVPTKPSEESHGIPAPVPAKPSEESHPNRHSFPPRRTGVVAGSGKSFPSLRSGQARGRDGMGVADSGRSFGPCGASG